MFEILLHLTLRFLSVSDNFYLLFDFLKTVSEFTSIFASF